MLSITIPLYDEADNIKQLYDWLLRALEPLRRPFEVIFVNDGSADTTADVLRSLASIDSRIKVINLRRNYGQTAAMMAGIDFASGDIIIPMDGDLQNDPADIPRLLEKLDEGYDVVSGWRKDRKDRRFRRNLPSRIANWMISRISGVHLSDYGCSLKAYRRDVVKGVRLYGEMHRFIPIYAHWLGGRVTEIPVQHHRRQFGRSKYGLERIAKVVLDMVVIKFLDRYSTKPIYVFGGFGIVCFFISFVSGAYAVYLKLFKGISFILTPLPLLVVMTFTTGVTITLIGLLAEIIMRTYYESQQKSVYLVKDTLNFEAVES